MKAKRKIISLLAAVCVTACLSPAFAGDMAIMPGAEGIQGGQADSVWFGTYQQSSDGNNGFNIDPIKWRVLDTKPAGKVLSEGMKAGDIVGPKSDDVYASLQDWKEGDGLLLVADQDLDVYWYYDQVFDDPNFDFRSGKPEDCKIRFRPSVTWESSMLRSWLNGYMGWKNFGFTFVGGFRAIPGNDYTDRNQENKVGNFIARAFSAEERGALLLSVLENADSHITYDGTDYWTEGGSHTADKVFALSYDEITNKDYFPDADSRIAAYTDYVGAGGVLETIGVGNDALPGWNWWTRSPAAPDPNKPAEKGTISAVYVFERGFADYNGCFSGVSFIAVRPAFNLDMKSVLFTSAAGGKKGGLGTVAAIQPTEATEWKVTLKDANRDGFEASKADTEEDSENVVHVAYKNAKTGENEYISAVVVDGNGAYTHYGRIKAVSEDADKDGSVEIDLTGVDMEGKGLYVLNEQYNGGENDDTCLTDYASGLKAIISADTTVTPPASYDDDSSGCNAGFAGMLLLLALPLAARRKG